MKISTYPWLCLCFALVIISGVLLGCGTAGPSIGGSGVGADGNPWPARPARNNSLPAPNEAPKAPVSVLLRGSTKKDEAVALNVTEIKLKYDKEHWLSVANGESIGKLQPLPFRVDEKRAVALLSNGTIERRAYTDIQVSFAKEKTTFDKEKKSLPLTINTVTLRIGTWTPESGAANTLLLTMDGTKVKVTKAVAQLSTDAFTVKTSLPTGGISGTVSPVTPTTRVEVLWEGTTISFGKAVPTPDGAFTIPNLPPGKYQLKVNADGYLLSEPIEKPVTIDEKIITLEKQFQLVKEKTE